MKMKQTADAPQARPLPAQLMDLQTAAVLNGAGAVAILTRPGFAIGERIVRPAEVVVAPEQTGDVQPGT